MNRNKQGILLEPTRVINIPEEVSWLAGQGSGSWFELIGRDGEMTVQIRRYSPKGLLEFDSEFTLDGDMVFSPNDSYTFDYPSHFKRCTLVQNGHKFKFINSTI